MRYYLDTEFIERGWPHPIELISIGLVAENGTEYYAVASDGWDPSHASEWVQKNVLPFIEKDQWALRRSRKEIAEDIRAFIVGDKPEVWGYYSSYDWVIFCQLFGAMVDLPKGWPFFCRDVIQLCKDMGNPKLPKQPGGEHHALADARHIKTMHEFLLQIRASPPAP